MNNIKKSYLDQNLEGVGQVPCMGLHNHPGAPTHPQISHCPWYFPPSVPTDSRQQAKPEKKNFLNKVFELILH